MLRLAVAFAAASAAAVSIAQGASLGWHPVRDRQADVRPAALALRSVQLVQRGAQLELRVRTRGAWSAHDVASQPGKSLCLLLTYGTPARARSRVCVGATYGAPVLTEVMLDANGAPAETP